MRTRPWPIVILAVLHLLSPLGNLILSAWLEHMGTWAYFQSLVGGIRFIDFVDFFCLLPLAGISIFACKPWGYPVVLLVTTETIWRNYTSWNGSPHFLPLWAFTCFVALDVAFVGYLLLPEVRRSYMDPSLRWWESKPRFPVRQRASLHRKSPSADYDCLVSDLSEGGALIRTLQDLCVGEALQLRFSVLGRKFEVDGRVVYGREGFARYIGIEFVHTRESRLALQHLTKGLRTIGFMPKNRVSLRKDFTRWLKLLVTTGKGLVPEDAAQGDKKKAA